MLDQTVWQVIERNPTSVAGETYSGAMSDCATGPRAGTEGSGRSDSKAGAREGAEHGARSD